MKKYEHYLNTIIDRDYALISLRKRLLSRPESEEEKQLAKEMFPAVEINEIIFNDPIMNSYKFNENKELWDDILGAETNNFTVIFTEEEIKLMDKLNKIPKDLFKDDE